MSEMDVKALKAHFQIWRQERAADLTESKGFERYVFEQVLKDHDPADEDLDVGDLGEGDDGGIDGMYLYMGGQLIGDETDAPTAASDVELHIIQAKYENGFKETAIEKLESFSRDLLSYDKPVSSLTYLNSKVRDSIDNFRSKYEAILGKPHTLTVMFHYACIALDIPGPKEKVMTRAENLKGYVKSILTLAQVEFIPWAAGTLLASARSIPVSTVVVPYHRLFSTGDQSSVCLVRLSDFAQRVLMTEDGHLQTRFLEPNVRDYQGKSNTVNTGIRNTLENTSPDEDFWWLNNGITILATQCGTSGDQVRIENPEIVNGLQTSHEVFNWYKTRQGVADNRYILLRIIVSPDERARTRIIKATNSQTKVSDLNLLSTEPIQQTIEDRLRLYGLFYDRKKGQCRRLKRPINKIVGMRAMAQAVMSIVLREPDQARGRPETFIKANAVRVFDPAADSDLYASCIVLDRQVADYLATADGLTNDERRDLRYFMDMLIVSLVLKKQKPGATEIANGLPMLRNIDKSVISAACGTVKEVYLEMGASDQIAKSREMSLAIEDAVGVLLK
jgi:hypothetical protein